MGGHRKVNRPGRIIRSIDALAERGYSDTDLGLLLVNYIATQKSSLNLSKVLYGRPDMPEPQTRQHKKHYILGLREFMQHVAQRMPPKNNRQFSDHLTALVLASHTHKRPTKIRDVLYQDSAKLCILMEQQNPEPVLWTLEGAAYFGIKKDPELLYTLGVPFRQGAEAYGRGQRQERFFQEYNHIYRAIAGFAENHGSSQKQIQPNL